MNAALCLCSVRPVVGGGLAKQQQSMDGQQREKIANYDGLTRILGLRSLAT